MPFDPTAKRDALRRLAAAARPFGLRVEKTPFSELPDLVLLRLSDGLEVARLRFFDDDPGAPAMRSIFPPSVTHAEQAEIEEHMAQALGPLVAELFSYPLWASLADAHPEN